MAGDIALLAAKNIEATQLKNAIDELNALVNEVISHRDAQNPGANDVVLYDVAAEAT